MEKKVIAHPPPAPTSVLNPKSFPRPVVDDFFSGLPVVPHAVHLKPTGHSTMQLPQMGALQSMQVRRVFS